MAQIVYGLTRDNGDGSNGVSWFRDKAKVDFILDRDNDEYQEYYGNEGSPNQVLTFPDDLDLVACGFRFRDDSIEISE